MKMPKDFDFSRTYYVAGPMTGYEHYNYPAFDKALRDLEAEGVSVQSPHLIPWPSEPQDGEKLWQTMMRQALLLLLEQCNGIILLPNFVHSKGAMLEHNVAASLQMPAYFLDGKYLVPFHEPIVRPDDEEGPLA